MLINYFLVSCDSVCPYLFKKIISVSGYKYTVFPWQKIKNNVFLLGLKLVFLYMFYFLCHEIYIRTGKVDAHCFSSTDLAQIFQDRLSVRALKDALTFAKRVHCHSM